MNIYVVVEGRVVEKIVYTHWVPYVNSALSCVPALADVVDNHFIVVSGGGYPNYLRVIEDAVQDMKDNLNFQRLVIAVDSEEMTYEEKHKEIDDFVQSLNPTFDYRIVVQHFCFKPSDRGTPRTHNFNSIDDCMM